MNPLNLIPAPWNLVAKIVLPLLLLAGAAGFGYYEGYKHEKVVVQSQIVTKVVTHTKYVVQKEQPKETAQLSKSQSNHDKVVAGIEALPSQPVPAECPDPSWGPDVIGLLNSQRGTLPSEPQ